MSRLHSLIIPSIKVLIVVVGVCLLGEALQRVKSFGAAGLTYGEMHSMTNPQQIILSNGMKGTTP